MAHQLVAKSTAFGLSVSAMQSPRCLNLGDAAYGQDALRRLFVPLALSNDAPARLTDMYPDLFNAGDVEYSTPAFGPGVGLAICPGKAPTFPRETAPGSVLDEFEHATTVGQRISLNRDFYENRGIGARASTAMENMIASAKTRTDLSSLFCAGAGFILECVEADQTAERYPLAAHHGTHRPAGNVAMSGCSLPDARGRFTHPSGDVFLPAELGAVAIKTLVTLLRGSLPLINAADEDVFTDPNVGVAAADCPRETGAGFVMPIDEPHATGPPLHEGALDASYDAAGTIPDHDNPPGPGGREVYDGRLVVVQPGPHGVIVPAQDWRTRTAKRYIPRLCARVVVLFDQPVAAYQGQREQLAAARDAFLEDVQNADPINDPDELLNLLVSFACSFDLHDSFVCGFGAASRYVWPASCYNEGWFVRAGCPVIGLPAPNFDSLLFGSGLSEHRTYDPTLALESLLGLAPSKLYTLLNVTAIVETAAYSLAAGLYSSTLGIGTKALRESNMFAFFCRALAALGAGDMASPWSLAASTLHTPLVPTLGQLTLDHPQLRAAAMPQYTHVEILDVFELSRPAAELHNSRSVRGVARPLQDSLFFSGSPVYDGAFQAWFQTLGMQARHGMRVIPTMMRNHVEMPFDYGGTARLAGAGADADLGVEWYAGRFYGFENAAGRDIPSPLFMPIGGPGRVSVGYEIKINPAATAHQQRDARLAMDRYSLIVRAGDARYRYVGTRIVTYATRVGAVDPHPLDPDEYELVDDGLPEPIVPLLPAGNIAAAPAAVDFGAAGPGLEELDPARGNDGAPPPPPVGHAGPQPPEADGGGGPAEPAQEAPNLAPDPGQMA